MALAAIEPMYRDAYCSVASFPHELRRSEYTSSL
jgi:hypothetical protein